MSSNKVEEKLDLIVAELSDIKVILAKQEVNIAEHMRRTELLEEAHSKQDEKNHKANKEVHDRIDPLYERKAMLDGVFKFLGFIALMLSITAGMAKLFGQI